MRQGLFAVVLGVGALVAAPVSAQSEADAAFDEVHVKARLDPGPNLFALETSWDGASRYHVLAAAGDMAYKGQLSTGSMAQGTVSADGKTAYTVSVYMERITRGAMKAYLEIFDAETATLRREIELPPIVAMVGPYEHLLQLSADETHLFIMNATPATSVTVVDLASGEILPEVPTPGCWSLYPATSGLKFSSLCGDGAMNSFAIDPNGGEATVTKSEPFFDVEADPLFVHAVRRGDALVFVSFGGVVHTVTDAGDAPGAEGSFSIVEGVEGGWAPGGYSVLAYNPAHDVLFVTMHEGAYDGSHKDAAGEVWAVDMKNEETLYRSPVEAVASIAATPGEAPSVFGFSEEHEKITRYAVDPDARFALKPEAEAELAGGLVMDVRQ